VQQRLRCAHIRLDQQNTQWHNNYLFRNRIQFQNLRSAFAEAGNLAGFSGRAGSGVQRKYHRVPLPSMHKTYPNDRKPAKKQHLY